MTRKNSKNSFEFEYSIFQKIYEKKPKLNHLFNTKFKFIETLKDDSGKEKEMIISFLETYNLGTKTKDFFEFYAKDYVLLLITYKLFGLGVREDFIKHYLTKFKEKYFSQETYKYIFEYIFFNTINGKEINLYITSNDVKILTLEDYISQGFDKENFVNIEINFNSIFTKIFNIDRNNEIFVSMYDNLLFTLINTINSDLYQKDNITINFKKNKIKDLVITGKEFNLNRRNHIQKNIQNGCIGKIKYKGINKYIKIIEKIKVI